MNLQGTFHRHAFGAMGSLVEVMLIGGSWQAAQTAFGRATELAGQWERTFSRFNPESELSRLNQLGSVHRASPELFDGVAAAFAGARRTGGLFDPTVLPALLDLGYDRSFSEIVAAGREATAPVSRSQWTRGGRWEGIALDPIECDVVLPDGVQIDLGGIAKGLYADRLVGELAGWPGGIISAGGDMRVWGVPPDGDRWIVGVENPNDPDNDITWLELAAGAVATSGTNRRYWRRAGQAVHHLIDPRTGRSPEHRLQSVTAVAESAAEAEIGATALFVAGQLVGTEGWLAATIIIALGIDIDGQLHILHHQPEGHHHATNRDAA